MSELLKDLHVSALTYVGESASPNPPANASKYKRFSIPYNPNRHCLGYIEGPAASLIKNTRNDRGYVTRLWRNIENSDDFQEGMKCATIVGELDHPEERVDYSLANGAIILTDWEIREDEGILWARFAILDNPRGRDLLAYVKFGTVLGVSSRGLGDEIVQNGRTIIDPDTYEFYCFDVVAFPAAEVARQSYVEPDALKEAKSIPEAFSERVLTEASKCTDKQQLTNLQNVVESTSLDNKSELIEAIADKLSSLPEGTGSESTSSDEDEQDDEKQILLSNQASEDLAAKDAQINSLKEKLQKRGENAKYFRKIVQEQQTKITELEDAVSAGLGSLDTLTEETNKATDKLKLAENKLSEKSQMDEKLIANMVHRLRSNKLESLRAHRKMIKTAIKENNELLEKNNSLVNRIDSLEVMLKESAEKESSLKRKLESQLSHSQKALKESKVAESFRNHEISMLKRQLSESVEAGKDTSRKLESARNTVKEVKERLSVQEAASKKLLSDYVRKASIAAGIQYEAVVNQLPSNFKKEDADALIEKLAERQRRFDTLPISVTPSSTRVVEHTARGQADKNSFLFKALSQSN